MSSKIDALTSQEKNRKIEISKENKQADNEMFSLIRTALDVDEECKKYTGKTKNEIIQEVGRFKKKCKDQAKERISDFFIDAALSDIDLLFDTVFTSLCCFTMQETFNVYRKILARVEKILAENEKFYGMSKAEKDNLFKQYIEQYIPDWQIPYYKDLLVKEKENSFSLYSDFIEKIQAQDFILRGSFINIQYDNNGNFMIINFPDFLQEINCLFIEHLVTNFTYRHTLKFGPSAAILDLEDQGYRFNMIHKSIDVSKETSIFIRKNISKSKGDQKLNFDFESYYYNLFSELPNDKKLAVSIIEKANMAKKKLEYKFEGFKSKDFEYEPYGPLWYLVYQKGIEKETAKKFLDNLKIEVKSDKFNDEELKRFIDETTGDTEYESIYEMDSDEDSKERRRDVKAIKAEILVQVVNKINESIKSDSEVEVIDIAKYAVIDVMKRTVQEKNVIVCGPTGSGKSTLLGKILSEKQLSSVPEQNLLTIEDTPELNVPYAISYVTNQKYKIHDIFVATLRQNPSRVIIGETRGSEIIDILETCLTSKSGTTIHATDFNKMVMRLKLMVKNEMVTEDLLYLTSSAVDIFVFIIARKVTSVYIRNSNMFNGSLQDCYDKIF